MEKTKFLLQQQRSTSKGPQSMQNGINNKIGMQPKQNSIIKRNGTNLPALGTLQYKTNVKRQPLQNAVQVQPAQIQQINSNKKINEEQTLTPNQKLQQLTIDNKLSTFQPYKQQSQYNDVMGMSNRNLQRNEE